MKTEILRTDPKCPDPAVIARAAALIRAGSLVAFPTETVYGLGANAFDAAAVTGIFSAKGRPATNPVIVHIADVAAVLSVAAEWPDRAARLAKHFWPGPLTLVLPRSPAVPDVVTAGGPTVAVRVPAHPVARALLEATGLPVAAPSANRSNQLSPTTAGHVWNDLNGRVPLILDGGPTTGGLESTVLDVTAEPARLLRPGLVSPVQLEAVIGPIVREGIVAASGPLASPGMLLRHYAPRTPLECIAGGAERVAALTARGVRVGWLAFGTAEKSDASSLRVMPTEPAAYATQLYAALHEMDAADVDRIVVSLPPDGDEWLMIHDRLRRAATP